jgi:CspA family cold shock protein
MGTKVESGKVKFFNIAKGYGFVACTDGKEYFFHFTGLLDKVEKDDHVTFEIEEGNRGLKAINMQLVK